MINNEKECKDEIQGTTIHCLLCDTYITGDRRGHLLECRCGACYIDETPDYYRIGGDSNYIEIKDSDGNFVKMSDLYSNYTNKSTSKRIDKINYYLNIAEEASKRSTCLKKNYGAIIVKNDEIISTGYNGAPRGLCSCIERGKCLRKNSDRGTDYSNCVSCHAEMNAIISASRQEMIDSTMYLSGRTVEGNYVEDPSPCSICKRLIINAGIKKVFVRINKDTYKEFDVSLWNEDDITGGY